MTATMSIVSIKQAITKNYFVPSPRCARSGACESGECLTQRAWGSYRGTYWCLGAGASGAGDSGDAVGAADADGGAV